MDSWTLHGDSYPFLRNAPRTFSLCHRDGTPNHVEIFDIINVPNQRSAISETTCLCDIFGDDYESTSIQSSPSAAAFTPLEREGEDTTAASIALDDVNDSSGSYHTAHGFSEEEEGFGDSGENFSSHAFQEQQHNSSCPDLDSGDRICSPGKDHHCTVNPGGRLSTLSSSSADNRLSPSSHHSKGSGGEPEKITLSPIARDSTQTYQFPTLRESPLEKLFDPTTAISNSNSYPSPDPHYPPDSGYKSRSISPSFLPSPSGTKIVFHSTSVAPEFGNSSSISDTQVLLLSPELRGRVSLPDLFSRNSTPDTRESPCNIESFSDSPILEQTDVLASENNGAKLSAERDRSSSTNSPRQSQPSPVASAATSTDLGDDDFSPELRNIVDSPRLLTPASSAQTGTRSFSSDPLPVTENFYKRESQVSSPVEIYSLSPSPGFRDFSSPVDHRYSSPSPEVNRRGLSAEVQITSASPISEPHFSSSSPRSFTSSSYITEISNCAVQPVDRGSPSFPELSPSSTPQESTTHMSDNTCLGGREAEFPDSPRGSPQTSASQKSVSPYSTDQMPQHYHTPSPKSNPLSSLLQVRSPACLSNQIQSSSPHKNQNMSPISPFLELDSSHSSHTSPSEICFYGEQTKQVTRRLSPDSFAADGIRREQSTPIGEDNPPMLSHLNPLSKEQSTERNISPVEKGNQEIMRQESPIGEKKEMYFSQVLDNSLNPYREIHSVSSNPQVHNDRRSVISPIRQESPTQADHLKKSSPVQPTSPLKMSNDMIYSPTSTCTPEVWRRRPIKKIIHNDREGFAEDVSHHVKRRQTPSPPLTRFTPIHIIAPQKPTRHWQNRNKDLSQVLPSSSGGHLKKAVTKRGDPNVDLVDNNSRSNLVRLGKQLETRRQMPPEQERDIGMEWQKDSETDRVGEREEREPERGEGWQRVASYRGKQVELSFTARNRKGPTSCSAAPTGRETHQGLPTAHSYSESLLATRQLQQQHSPLKLTSQQDTRSGSASRRSQPPVPQNKKSATARGVASRPCQSSGSSMGSELDEADSEVKWFTDIAAGSLSSSEVEYLDMYNSSCRSSANASQPSTQDSPAGVNPAWMAYADFRGSAPKLDHEEPAIQESPAYNQDGLDPARCHELGSFECIDVALEKEDYRQLRRGVPKRQIQLKRKNNGEESSENSSTGLSVSMEIPVQEAQPKRSILRQHSTPAAIQDCHPSESSVEHLLQKEKQFKFQKSASMDETCSKTKMASCLIKSVLSKKMQIADGHTSEHVCEDICPQVEDLEEKELLKITSPKDAQSDFRFISEGVAVREESVAKDEAKPPSGHGFKSSNRPGSSNSSRSICFSQTDSEEADSQSRDVTPVRCEVKSELKVTLDSKQPKAEVDQIKTREREKCETESSSARNSRTPATKPHKTLVGAAEREKSENTSEHNQQLLFDRGAYTSRKQELSLNFPEKKKRSLNINLTPETENQPSAFPTDVPLANKENKIQDDEKLDGKEENVDAKAPIHKVRDVRRLVKNSYNLSFKAADAALPSSKNEGDFESVKEENEKEVTLMVERSVEKERISEENKEEEKTDPSLIQTKGSSPAAIQPIQIQCKAVCWKNEKNQTEIAMKETSDRPQMSSHSVTEVREKPFDQSQSSFPTGEKDIRYLSERESNMTAENKNTTKEREIVSENEEKFPKMEAVKKLTTIGNLSKLPNKEREVSTAVVLIRDKIGKIGTSPFLNQNESPDSVQATVPPSLTPSPGTPESRPGSGSHSVSMLLKEKGYHADIGAVVGDTQNAVGATQSSRKHVNSLEIPLRTTPPTDAARTESHRDRTISSSSTEAGPSSHTDTQEASAKCRQDEGLSMKPPLKDLTKSKKSVQELKTSSSKSKDVRDFEAVKRLDPTFPPKFPGARKIKPQTIEMKSPSSEPPKQEEAEHDSSHHRPQAIEVKSIAKSSQRPAVPPKPSCKFKPADLQTNESTGPIRKQQSDDKAQTIVVSSPTVYRKISNESTLTSRKLAVSAVSSFKPPAPRAGATTITSFSNQLSDMETLSERGQQQQRPPTPPQSSSDVQEPASIRPISEAKPDRIPVSTFARGNQLSNEDPKVQMPHPRAMYPNEQATDASSNSAKQTTCVTTSQPQRCLRNPQSQSNPGEHSKMRDEMRLYAADDPPSYEERESFSPLLLQDLIPSRTNRYQPLPRAPPCLCTAGCPSHSCPAPPHHHHSPHNITPPAQTHSPGQALPYQVNQPSLRSYPCRPEAHPLTYQPSSPKSSSLCLNQPSSMYHPLHQAGPCPPHLPMIPGCSAERPLQPVQHVDPRRPPVRKSPHQQHNIAAAPYSDPGHGHSPGLPPIDPQYLCGAQNIGPSYGSDYGADSSSLYSENSYGQAPRRVLLDPETGKYFYIEVPVQPLRKMLFDPETGQYVEVLIPQQAITHSGLYPSSAAPFPALHSPNMYAPAPQYMPCAAPPVAHSQTQPQPPRYAEPSGAGPMHPNAPGVAYRHASVQGSKSEHQNHQPLDHSYLEGMYYIPTGMNASPNPTPPDYYHKRPPNLPPSGGRKS